MRVSSLRLRNFRCFVDESFAFRHAFTVLIGDNGSGKSAVLDALGLALALESSIFGTRRKADFPDVRLRPTATPDRGIPALPASIALEGTVGGANGSWEIDYQEGGSISFGGPHLWGRADLDADRPLPLIASYSTARLSVDTAKKQAQGRKEHSRLDAYRNSLSGSLDTAALTGWFRSRTGQSLQAGEDAPDLDMVLRATRSALRYWNTLAFDFAEDELVATREITPGGRTIRLAFSRLSDGQRAFLALVGDLARRCAVLNGHLGPDAVLMTEGVVLIDELDLHLHPKWQRTVVDDLQAAFPRIQFIATTHSPFIVQSLPAHAVIDLSNPEVSAPGGPINEPEARDFRKASIEDIAEQAMGVEMPQMSERRQAFLEAARHYYSLLESPATENGAVEAARMRMHELGAPFADDLAFVAFEEATRREQ